MDFSRFRASFAQKGDFYECIVNCARDLSGMLPEASVKGLFTQTQVGGIVETGPDGRFSLKKGEDFYFRRLTERDQGGKKWGVVGQSGAKN